MENIEDLDSSEAIPIHRKIIQEKYFLRQTYLEFYQQLAKCSPRRDSSLVIVEIGSGGGFIKEVIPGAITSDIRQDEAIDRCFSAEKIPFARETVDVFLMLNVFHHFSRVRKSLTEISRCLRPGGKLVMIEPANTWWRRVIDRNFHTEPFDICATWNLDGDGPMTSANGALPWIVFSRDREIFQKEFPELQIKHIHYHTSFRYLVSGGLSYPQFLPAFFYPIIKMLEFLVSPFEKTFGYFQTIEIQKIKGEKYD